MTDGMDNSPYRRSYGVNPSVRPDFARCCVAVQDRISFGFNQCRRKRGHGPGKAYCKQHDPAAVKARAAASQAKYDAVWQKRRIELGGERFLNALREIAAGHNDPRALAAEIVKEFEND